MICNPSYKKVRLIKPGDLQSPLSETIYIFLIAKTCTIQKNAVSLRIKKGIGEMIMANNEYRKLPVGIQSFNVIREEGYLYVELDEEGKGILDWGITGEE